MCSMATKVCLVETQHIITFSRDFFFTSMGLFAWYCFFFLNLGAIIALETTAVCVCARVCVRFMALYKGIQTYSVCQKGIQVFLFLSAAQRTFSRLMSDLLSDIMLCLCSLVHAGTVKSNVCIHGCVCFLCVFSSILSCVSFLGVSKGMGPSVLNVPLLYFVLFVFLPIKRQHCGIWTLNVHTGFTVIK